MLVFGIDEQWAVDLIEVINIAKYNRGYRYLLTVVDVLSKHAWVQPVKSKTGKAVTDAFEKILKGRRKPINLQTDDDNKTFQGLMKRKGIHHFSTSGDTKASVVERFNRTLKRRMYRYLTVKNALGENWSQIRSGQRGGKHVLVHTRRLETALALRAYTWLTFWPTR